MFTLLIIILILMLLGVVPAWPHTRAWGNSPAGVVLTLILVVILLRLFGVII